MGKVPVLVDGDFTLFESVAIARYILDNKAPDNTIYPKDVKVRAKIDEAIGHINDFRNLQGLVMLGRVILPRSGKSLPEKIVVTAETFLAQGAQKINDHLTGKKYFAQDRLTLADFLLVENVMALKMGLKWDFVDYPEIKRYFDGIIAEVPILSEQWQSFQEIVTMLSNM